MSTNLSTAVAPLAQARALHLVDDLGVGGVARSAIELVRHARMDGEGDELVIVGRPLDVSTDFAAPATPVHFLDARELGPKAAAQRLADLAASRGTQTLHTWSTAALTLARGAQRRGAGLGYLATLTELPPTDLGFFERRRLRDTLRRAERRIALAPRLAAAWGELGAEVEVHPIAVDLSRFRPGVEASTWRQSRGIGSDTLLIGALLRASDDKDHDLLIDAVAELRSRGVDAALQFVGDGPRRAALVERARSLPWLHVRRRVLDVTTWFAMVDVVAFASAQELAPLAMIEAMACGRATVAVDPGGLADLVGESAFLVPPGNVGAYVEALAALADGERRSQLGFAAREHAAAHHGLAGLRRALAPAYHR